MRRFKSYSKYPPCYKDVAFWISDAFTENNLCEVVRDIAGDLAEEVKLIDDFTHPKTVSGRVDAAGGKAHNSGRVAMLVMQLVSCVSC